MRRDPADEELISVMGTPRHRLPRRDIPPPRGPASTDGPTTSAEDFHDPLAGLGGLPPARSALTLRAVLALFGLVVCTAGAVGLGIAGASRWYVIALTALALVAVIDFVVILRRKRRGEPG